MTITIDDAGSGDLLFGVVIGAFQNKTEDFYYDILDVKYFKSHLFYKKQYLKQASKIVKHLINRFNLSSNEEIHLCKSYMFDNAEVDLKRIYGNRIHRKKIIGKTQHFTETAYLDEIRNLGYEPLLNREEKRAKSFFHMMRWLEKNPKMLRYAKTGWPRLSRYRLFKSFFRKQD